MDTADFYNKIILKDQLMNREKKTGAFLSSFSNMNCLNESCAISTDDTECRFGHIQICYRCLDPRLLLCTHMRHSTLSYTHLNSV